MEKNICIIVPGYGSCPTLKNCLHSLCQVDYPNFEIIFVDDGLEDTALTVLESFKDKINILKSNSKGPSFARNLAAKQTAADFLAFTDSDCIVPKNWLSELLKGLEKFTSAASCGGRQEIPDDATDFEKQIFAFFKKTGFITDYMRKTANKGLQEVEHNASCNVLYRRDIFLKSGGFLEELWPGEDVEIDYKLRKMGHQLIFNPNSLVYHYRPKNLKSFLKMMFRYGWAQGFLVKRYGLFRKIQLLPFLSLLTLILFILSLILKKFVPLLIISGSGIIFLFIYLTFNIQFIYLTLLGFIYWNIGFFKKFLGR